MRERTEAGMNAFADLLDVLKMHVENASAKELHRAILDLQLWWTEFSKITSCGSELGARCTAINATNGRRCKRRDTWIDGLCAVHHTRRQGGAVVVPFRRPR